MSWGRMLLQIPAYVAFAALIGYFSAAPVYQHLAPDRAVVKLSFSHAGERKVQCRQRTPEELAKLAPNMRATLDCPRERSSLLLELELDGKLVLRREVQPSGLRRDGNAVVYERMALPAGRHRIVARLRDRPEGDFNFVRDETLELAGGRSLIIDFNAAQGGFVFRG